jgi:hypothetical protein
LAAFSVQLQPALIKNESHPAKGEVMQSNLRAHINLLFAALAALAGCAQPPTIVCDGPSDLCVCEYNGQYYAAGEQFMKECNTCICGENGEAGCTKIGCEPPAQSCGGDSPEGGQCSDSEFCSYAPEAICGRADATGTCQPRPEICDVLSGFVCGCNGESYLNACHAHAAGSSVDHLGLCE